MTRRRTPKQCVEIGCEEEPVSLGRCSEHARAYADAKELRKAAGEALWKMTVDQQPVTDAGLRDELYRLTRWWDRVSAVIRGERKDAALGDQADLVSDQCTVLAVEIVKAERVHRLMLPADDAATFRREILWSKLEALDDGTGK